MHFSRDFVKVREERLSVILFAPNWLNPFADPLQEGLAGSSKRPDMASKPVVVEPA